MAPIEASHWSQAKATTLKPTVVYSAHGVALPEHGYRESIAVAAYEQAGLGPEDLDLAEVYDLSTALELDWCEAIGLCDEGEAEKLVRNGETELGGRIPVNVSGGLSSFGEAVPAQAIAQVCEVAWHLRGEAGARQVEGAKVALAHGTGGILSTHATVLLGVEA